MPENAAASTQQLTIRLSPEEHQALKAYAFVTGKTMNEAVRQAILEFIAGAGRDELFDRAVDQARSQYRVALDKLKDM